MMRRLQTFRLNRRVAAFMLILFFLPFDAGAFDIKSLPIITPANNFIEKPKKFFVGEDLELIVKQSISAMKHRKADFQVRVFRLPDGVSGDQNPEPKPWNKIDDCLIFLSSVLQVKGGNSESIILIKLDEKWLTPNTDHGMAMKPGSFLLVFEKINDTGNIFRLKKDSAAAYFQSGVVVTVNPIRAYSKDEIENRQTKLTTAQNNSKAQIGQNSQSLPCYRFKPLAVSEKKLGDIDDAPVTLCFADPSSPKWAAWVPFPSLAAANALSPTERRFHFEENLP